MSAFEAAGRACKSHLIVCAECTAGDYCAEGRALGVKMWESMVHRIGEAEAWQRTATRMYEISMLRNDANRRQYTRTLLHAIQHAYRAALEKRSDKLTAEEVAGIAAGLGISAEQVAADINAALDAPAPEPA